jgi:hypothetical protein
MQSANRIPSAAPLEPATGCGLLEDPQAAIATAHVTAVSVIRELWRWLLGGLLVRP